MELSKCGSLPTGVVGDGNRRQHRQVEESSSLEVFKNSGDVALWNMV